MRMLKTLVNDAFALAGRYRETEGLGRYVEERRALIAAAAALLLVLGVACGAGTFLFLAGWQSWLALPGLMLAPLVALVSLAMLFYLFFGWLEGRALERALANRSGRRARHAPGRLRRWLAKKARIDLGAPPPRPWPAAAGLLAVPFLLLALAAPLAAALLVLLAAALPLLYARFDPLR